MKIISLAFLLFTLVFFTRNDVFAQQQQIFSDTLYQADPTIFKSGNICYLYGTNGGNSDSGFKVFTSTDLLHWHANKKNNGFALLKGNQTYGTKGFWAPQVFTHNGTFYMAYTANEHIAIAQSSSPDGLFTQKKTGAIDTSIKQIDPFVFFDNGNIYLYHVRLQNGNRIFVEELNPDFSIRKNTLHECISAVTNGQAWEDTKSAEWTVTEGPTVIKRNSTYYLFYSANDFRNPDYAVGYATASSPVGPWKKWEKNPIIDKKLIGINGTGHGDILEDANGTSYYVFHTHFSNEKTGVRKTAIIKLNFGEDGSVSADKNSFHYLTTDHR